MRIILYVTLMAVLSSGNLAFLACLLGAHGRNLPGRSLLAVSAALPVATTALVMAYGFGATDLRGLMIIPSGITYSLLGLTVASYRRSGAPSRHVALLMIPLAGTTVLLFFVWFWISFTVPGV